MQIYFFHKYLKSKILTYFNAYTDDEVKTSLVLLTTKIKNLYCRYL